MPNEKVSGVAVIGLRRGRDIPRKHWTEVIAQDMIHHQLTDDITLNRWAWRSRIRVDC